MSDLHEANEWDWVVLPSYGALHHARGLYDVAAFDEDAMGSGVTTCGRAGILHVPGMFTRSGAPRCKRCCKALGYPQGWGSPKNDDACRPLVEARLASLGVRP